MIKEISVQELKKLQDNKEDFQLIDVREPDEIEICSIGGESIPMGDVMDNIDKISKTKRVIFHCKSGRRSAAVIQSLQAHHGFNNLYNLTGGILAWANEIDPSLTKY